MTDYLTIDPIDTTTKRKQATVLEGLGILYDVVRSTKYDLN